MIASRPLLFTMDKSFSEGPLGRFSPRSHSLTSFGFTFRKCANLPWLTPARLRIATICLADSGKDRPTDFPTKQGTNTILMTLKKVVK